MPESIQQNPERLSREQPIEKTAEVQGNYLNFKQNLAEKDKFFTSQVNESQPLFGNCRLGAAGFQKMTTRALSKKIRVWKQKLFPKSCVFSINFLRQLN